MTLWDTARGILWSLLLDLGGLTALALLLVFVFPEEEEMEWPDDAPRG